MAFATSYTTDEFTAYEGDVIKTYLSLAIWLIDDFTGKEIIGNAKAIINEGNLEAIRNPSGYYIFIDLETGNYTVNIKSDLYFPAETKVESSSISETDPKNPVIPISLKPRPEYPFSKNATLVRGQAVSSSNKPLGGARIGIEGKCIETVTDSRGEFVIYLEATENEETLTLKINGKSGPTITVYRGKTARAGKIIEDQSL